MAWYGCFQLWLQIISHSFHRDSVPIPWLWAACDGFDQWAMIELRPCDFWGWVVDGHTVPSSFSGIFIRRVLTRCARSSTIRRLPLCDKAQFWGKTQANVSAEPCQVTSSGAYHVSIKPSDDSSPSHLSGHQPFVFPPAVMERRQAIMSTRKWLLLYAVKFGDGCCTSAHNYNNWIRWLSLLHGIMKSQQDCWGHNPQGGRAGKEWSRFQQTWQTALTVCTTFSALVSQQPVAYLSRGRTYGLRTPSPVFKPSSQFLLSHTASQWKARNSEEVYLPW